MSLVTLVSGGLDSTLMAVLTKESGIAQYPLFVNYGQRAVEREFSACKRNFMERGLPEPEAVDLSGFGHLIRSGLTDGALRIVEDAFTPGRNLLFLLIGGSYAHAKSADGVAIGLLSEATILFPDQTSSFLMSAQSTLRCGLGIPLNVTAPLMSFSKQDVVRLAEEKGIRGTYSCHAGGAEPCGVCIACREFQF
jgi:7-cyano-7-deazaguanine synthase